MSFSCPHFEFATEQCLKLNALCVPGRPGCVLGSKAVFAVPVEERLEARGEKRRGKAGAAIQRGNQIENTGALQSSPIYEKGMNPRV